MAKSSIPAGKSKPTLGAVVMVYTKSSPHWCALIQPEVITIEGMKFIAGTQVTGKEGHRMERKRTLIPFEHVASLVEFASEEDLWSEPQPKHIRPPDETRPNTLLTSHEQTQQKPQHGGGRQHRRDRRHGNDHRGNTNSYPDRQNFGRGRGFDR